MTKPPVRPTNDTPTPEQPSKPVTRFVAQIDASLTDLTMGQDVYVAAHQAEIGGVRFTEGGHPALFQGAYKSQTGKIYARVYWNGTRTYPIEVLRDPRRKSVVIGGKHVEEAAAVSGISQIAKKGDLMIECIGVPGKPCGKTRAVHAADRHLVKRCKECQKEFGRIATRARMKQKRAERKVANAAATTPKKTPGRPGGDLPRAKNTNPVQRPDKVRKSRKLNPSQG